MEATARRNSLRVILVSSVRPNPGSAGSAVLHRHLIGHPNLQVEIYGEESKRAPFYGFLRCIIAKCVNHSALREGLWTLLRGKWIKLPLIPPSDQPTVVLTVAHGDGYLAAMRLAEREDWPLVSIYHDWWPNLAAPPGAIRSLIEKRFRELYKKSKVALCVSEGMRSALGAHPDARIHYPIPDDTVHPPALEEAARPVFRILFFGNLGVYGKQVGQALEAFYHHPTIRLEVRGGETSFPAEFEARMRAEGSLLSYENDVASFREWARTADAFLIPQSFEDNRRMEMETNFPSKLLEASRYGKPLVVWAPPWGSAARWAKDSDAALAVTNADPGELLGALERLRANERERKRLSDAAIDQANSQFHPGNLQDAFVHALVTAALS